MNEQYCMFDGVRHDRDAGESHAVKRKRRQWFWLKFFLFFITVCFAFGVLKGVIEHIW